eukprot:263281-Pelagomonas_calceolata.AAC.1
MDSINHFVLGCSHPTRQGMFIKEKKIGNPGPLPSLQKAAEQRASTISRIRTRCFRNPNRNNKVTLQTILLGVAIRDYL